MAKPELKAAVLGDSAMWGEGLLEKDKFSTKAIAEISSLLGREARIVSNTARCGAAIKAALKDKDAISVYGKFVDTYPHLFPDTFTSDAIETDFTEGNRDRVEKAAIDLHHEIPAIFPTVLYQLKQLPEDVAHDVGLVLINGGANDVDFVELLNPEEHRKNFVAHYESILRTVTFVRVKSLLRLARKKFPDAVIIFTGYFQPFFPGVSSGELEKLFEHESHEESWKVALNRKLNFTDVGMFVVEAQQRAQFAVSRGIHWQRKAVQASNADVKLRGAGFLFVHPQFGPENSVFESNSFFHRQYRLDSIADAAKDERIANCPRRERYGEMEAIIRQIDAGFISGQQSALSDEALSNLRMGLNGPRNLLKALDAMREEPVDFSRKLRLREALFDELERINHIRRASFLHPNENGAQRYAAVISKRYTERIHRIRVRADLQKLQQAAAPRLPALRASLRRYGLGSVTSVRDMTQLMLVDAVAVEVTTAANSAPQMYDNIFINLGGTNRWQLNFPYVGTLVPMTGTVVPSKMLHSQFEPGKTDFFTIDARAIHLGSITQLVFESQGTHLSVGDWKPQTITLFINGTQVFRTSFSKALPRDGRISLGFPLPDQ